jgi:hypothetical protein
MAQRPGKRQDRTDPSLVGEDGKIDRAKFDEAVLRHLSGKQNIAEAIERTLSAQLFSATAVFDRLKEALECESDSELAWMLGTTPQNISHKRRRNSVPYRETVFVSLWRRVDLAYLLTGVGSLR